MRDNVSKLEDELKLKELYPRFAARIEDLLNYCDRIDLNEGRLGIFSGFRTWEEQAKLYAQGRTENGPIVSNTPPGYSWHNYGLACDVVFKDEYGNWDWEKDHPWDVLGRLALNHDLHWGGSWGDKPHFEANFGQKIETLRVMYEKDGLEKVWRYLDKA
jgi:peptidoglycan L-alanyl-D-glutamate endopeptidase CwlK